MRAVTFDGSSITLADHGPDPEPAPGEALIRPARVLLTEADALAAGLGSGAGAGGGGGGGGGVGGVGGAPVADTAPGAHAFKGVLGSQFVGVVRKINLPPDAGSLLLARKGWVGKRVVAPPSIPCTSCDLCRAGLSAHCRARAVLGIHQRDGCLAEAFCVPLSALCAVPDSVPDEHAVLAHALSGALHAANMLRSEHSSYITVLGDSLIALLCAQALAGMNKAVRLLSSRDDRQRLCERWGVKCRALDEPGRRQDQDVVVDCTGAAAGLRLALQLVRPRGIILLKSPGALAPFPPGRPLPPPRPGGPWAQGVDLTPAIVNEVQILGSRDGPIPDALRALQDHTIDVAGLITRRARLEDAPSALKAWSPETLGVSIEV